MSSKHTVYLLDGSHYIFRAYYALAPLSARDGTPTNAVVGFARMLGKFLKTFSPQHIAIAFDTPAKTFRHHLYAPYKANRQEPPEDLAPQFDLIRQLVKAMALPTYRIEGYEADDILGTLATRASASELQVVIATGDKDLMQLVGPQITILDPMRDKTYHTDEVQEKLGVLPSHVADLLALAGDSSDNVPGVPKVGLKTAAKLINEFGDVDAILQGLSERTKTSAAERSVLENADLAKLSKQLTTIDTQVPITEDIPAALQYNGPNTEALKTFFQRIDAHQLLRDFVNEPIESTSTAEPTQHPYQTITTTAALQNICDAILQTQLFCFDLETTSLNAHQAQIVGIALGTSGQTAAYIPINHSSPDDTATQQLPSAQVIETLHPLWLSEKIAKLGHNLKYDATVLATQTGIHLRGPLHDTMLAAYVVDATRSSYALDALSLSLLNRPTTTYEQVAGRGKKAIGFDQVPITTATAYAAEDVDVTLALHHQLSPQLTELHLDSLYQDVEIPLMQILLHMEMTGIWIDQSSFATMSAEFSQRLEQLKEQAHILAGQEFNLASPKQLSHLLFEVLDYPVIKKTKTGYSTDHEVLETLSHTYELPRILLEHRRLSKLRSTYVDALPAMVQPHTNRLHTHYHQTGTSTGRLSSSHPNLQNIPIRSDEGRRIRQAFCAPAGWCILSADYSQIELRILAHLCADPSFIAAFQNNEDIHRRTAMEVLTGGEEPTTDERRQAKTINFGLLYGQGDFGLAKQLGIRRSEAKQYIETYFSRYPTIQSYFQETIEKARADGFVTTLLGRRRHLPDLHSRNANVRQAAERIAKNSPIQGSAADIMKLSMLAVDKHIKEQQLQTRILLQVHDELICEVPNDEIQTASQCIQDAMSQAFPLKVPLSVDIGHGASWGDAH